MTQEELAGRASLSVRAISDLERGVKTRPHVYTARQLAQALDLSLADSAMFLAVARGQAPDMIAIPDPGFSASVGNFLGAMPSGPLVGRHDELALVAASTELVIAGRGHSLLLTGEAGVGKTRVAQEVVLHLRRHGFVISTGRCYAPEQSHPFYPFIEMLTQLRAATSPALWSAAAERSSYLHVLLGDTGGTTYSRSVSGPEDQYLLFQAVETLLRAVAGTKPAALLLDDLHWADASSLLLFRHLARTLHSSRIFLLGTCRDEEVGREHGLESVMLELQRERLLDQIEIPRLNREETENLIALSLGTEDVSPALVEAVHRRTEGNAFFVEEVVRALVQQGAVYRGGDRWEQRAIDEIAVPKSVRAAIRQRLGHLPEETQMMLQEASVLGQVFTFDHVFATSGRQEDELERALEGGMAAGLIRPVGEDSYAFSHALAQQALYAELSPHRRRRFHALFATALEALPKAKQGNRAGDIAWNFLQAYESERALPYLLRAGDEAERVFAHAEAERYYRDALRYAQRLGDRDTEIQAQERLGMVLKTVARYDEALPNLEQAAAAFRHRGDRAGELRLAAPIGDAHALRGTVKEGLDRLEPVAHSVRPDDTDGSVTAVFLALARLYELSGRYEEQHATAGRASELANAAGDNVLLAEAEISRALAVGSLGDQEEALRILQAAVPIAEAAGDLHALSRALSNVVERLIGRTRSTYYADQAVAAAERLGDPAQLAAVLFQRTRFLLWAGDWLQMRLDLERAVELGRQSHTHAPYPLYLLGALCLWQGHHEEGRRYLNEALALAEETGDPVVVRFAQKWLAENDVLEGHPETGIARLEPFTVELNPWLLASLAWAYLEAGDIELALTTSRQTLGRVKEMGNRSAIAISALDAGRVHAMVLARQGLQDEAENNLLEAAKLSEGIPFMEGRILHELGLVQARQGRNGDAGESLAQALTRFRHLEAGQYIGRTEQAIEQLDLR